MPEIAAQMRPVILIHGYSDQGKDFQRWRDLLPADTYHVHIGDYVSLNNELTIKDIAEGFDRALDQTLAGQPRQTFDAIVHSTGMLVIRSWLTVYPERASRLKHLIGLAPATNGSPLAHKGRGLLGAIFKGNRMIGPDFLEAGDQILDALELGSSFTWDLANRDLFGARPFYGPDATTPYVFIFCGNQPYKGLRQLVVDEPGTDGTVRWCGASLNSRKITIDLTQPHPKERAQLAGNPNIQEIPLVLVEGADHTTILSQPAETLLKAVLDALAVDTEQAYAAWCENARRLSAAAQPYQQFVLRLVDERGDPIPDYHIQCFDADSQPWTHLPEFEASVHPYSKDPSLRNFNVKLSDRLMGLKRVGIYLTAASGTPLVRYDGYGDDAQQGLVMGESNMAAIQVQLSFPTQLEFDQNSAKGRARFFYPNTTTFIELKMNREPATNQVFSFK